MSKMWNTDHTSANCPRSDKTCRKCGKVGHLASACRSSETPQPKAKGGGKKGKGGKGASAVKTFWNCGESGHMSSQCPKKKVHAMEECTTASQAGSSQDTIKVGAIGSHFDLGSVSEGTLELRGADEKICSMGAANVREGEFVDIEVDTGAEVSCLPANIGADTYPLHETRLNVCGVHHVAAGGGKLHELRARILGLKAANVRGGCELVGAIQSHEPWQGTSVVTRPWPLWLEDGLPLLTVAMRIL